MLPQSYKLFKLARLTWLMRLFRHKRSDRSESVSDNTSPALSRSRIVSARGIDIDSLEEMMNRRLRTIWVRHTWFVVCLGFLVLVALVAVSVFLSVKPTILHVAVGPKGSLDVAFVEKFAERLKHDHTAGINLQPIVKDGPVTVGDIHGKSEFDVAVVRGNMSISPDWPVIAILRQNVVALMVPPASARAPVKKDGKVVKPPKIENVADLAGKRVGIVTSADGGQEVLQVILKHYGIPSDKVQVVEVAPDDLRSAIHDNKIDVILVAGPQTGKAIEEAVVAATHGKDGSSFIPIKQAEGIGKRSPPYDKTTIAAGAFGGIPPMPPVADDDLDTLSYPLYLVARKNLNEDKMANFSKALYTSRQALAYELPGIIAIESPSTDKDAPVLVHPGAAEYLGDNQKTVFDKYGDWIFYGLLVGPVFGSGLMGVLGYFRADKNTRRI